MSSQHAERRADSVRFWTDVKEAALAGGHHWIARMVEELACPRDNPGRIEDTVRS